jgi:hypothetical protein
MPTAEDRLVQRAVARIVRAMYAQDFLACSFGYRTGRHPPLALKALRDHLVTGQGRHVSETDMQGAFTKLHHPWLRKMIVLRSAAPVMTG